MNTMYSLLILSSKNRNEGTLNTLYSQMKYLEMHGVSVTLCVDYSEVALIRLLDKQFFDCAYIHIKKRDFKDGEEWYDATRVLEQKSIPLLGSSYISQLLAADKFLSSKKSGMGLTGLLVSRSMYNQDLIDWNTICEYPVIVKPNSFHASMGISKDSVIYSSVNLSKAVGRLFSEYSTLNEVLIEEFSSDGQEYTISVLGNGENVACSVSKLQYESGVLLRINSAEQKKLSLADRNFAFVVETDLSIRNRLEYHAKTLFRHFALKDYARFDFIVDKSFYFLEVNTNPMPGNGFSWEWQVKYGLNIDQIVSLYLCSFHFGQVASGNPSRLPVALIESLPREIIQQIEDQDAVNTVPECSNPSKNCINPQLYSMQDRVSSETEVTLFLNALTQLVKPSYIVETGTHKGGSTIAFAEGLRKNGHGRMDTIELDADLAQRAKILFSEYPVTVHQRDSLSFIPSGKINLLYLDSKREIRGAEFERFHKHLDRRAIIVWHDSSYREANHHVFDAIEDLYERKIIDRILLPTPRGITLSTLV